ncbi:hypothetical protein [Paragemmobacter straminiformis]|uniref:Uncharacterized protein n=1 Tax=Paragemmobacter straminiformis TaxID=2045119 RepID=A0A842I838_9RHOB|nr:hypothetical protein [Gemmobacter straminiformis]MBC2835158.1 hypothetical protein [Gemmobacter straminiformis]
MRRDWRTAEQILGEPRWAGLTERAGYLSLSYLRDVDRLFKLCDDRGIQHIDDVTEDLINDVDKGGVSSCFPRRLAKALQILLPGTILAERAAQNARQRHQAWVQSRPKQRTGRDYGATKTVPESALPHAWQLALADMRSGLGSATERPPAPLIIKTIAMKLRQLAKSSLDAGASVELSEESLAALHRDMNARGLSSYTKRATCSALGRFAKFINAPKVVCDKLRELTALHDANTSKEVKRKEVILHEVDVSARSVLSKAKELLAKSTQTTNLRSALTCRNEAYCLAVFTFLPLRLSDTRFRFGEELTWENGCWHLGLTTSKNGHDYSTRMNPDLNPFIDALALNGLSEAYLELARTEVVRDRRPVLITRSQDGVGYNYVSDVWRKYFKTGEHIARTEMHEAFAGISGPLGTELALAACAQHSPQSASHYHSHRIRTDRLAKMQRGLANLASGIPDKNFDFE